MKKFLLVAALMVVALTGCGKTNKESITVFNYGMYIDPTILDTFTEETGIEVKYEEALTPEELYSKYSSGAINYDLVCTTDYMLKKMIEEGDLQKVDYSKLEYADNIDQQYWDFAKAFDANNEYTLPYFWGTVGILYDTTKVDEEIDSWDVLFNGKYSGDIVMSDSLRDCYMIALKELGYSLNTSSEAEIREAQELLLKQKPDVQAYIVDGARDEVVAGNAKLAVIYSGEAYLGQEYNENLKYVIPKEGANIWMDAWGMTKECQNTEAAQKFLSYLCREDIAMKNFEEIYYSSPNNAVLDAMDPKFKEYESIFPSDESLENCEVCTLIDENVLSLYDELWKELKSE